MILKWDKNDQKAAPNIQRIYNQLRLFQIVITVYQWGTKSANWQVDFTCLVPQKLGEEKKKNQTSYTYALSPNPCDTESLSQTSALQQDWARGPCTRTQHPAAPTSALLESLSFHSPKGSPPVHSRAGSRLLSSGYTTSPASLAIVSFSTEGKHPANNPNNEPAGQFSARVSRYISVASDTLTSPSFWVDLLQLALKKDTPFLALLLPHWSLLLNVLFQVYNKWYPIKSLLIDLHIWRDQWI